MAGDGSFSKTSVTLSIISLVLVFLLILLITVTVQEDKVVNRHDRVRSVNDGGIRKILITVAAQEDKVVMDHDRVRSENDGGTPKMDDHGATETEWMDAHRTVRTPSTLRGERVFNASAHEVPSGPNPISNR